MVARTRRSFNVFVHSKYYLIQEY